MSSLVILKGTCIFWQRFKQMEIVVCRLCWRLIVAVSLLLSSLETPFCFAWGNGPQTQGVRGPCLNPPAKGQWLIAGFQVCSLSYPRDAFVAREQHKGSTTY